MAVIKSPWVTGGLLAQFGHQGNGNIFQLRGKLLKLFPSNLTSFVWGNMLTAMLVTLGHGLKVTLPPKGLRFCLDIVITMHQITRKLDGYISLAIVLNWINFVGILFKMFFDELFFKTLALHFQGQTFYQSYFRNADAKLKGRALNGCWAVWPWPLPLPMAFSWDFQCQILKLLYLRNTRADWHGTKGMSVDRTFDPLCDLELCPHPHS